MHKVGFIVILGFLLGVGSCSQNIDECSLAWDGCLKTDDERSVFLSIENNKYYEFNEKDGFFFSAKISWEEPCKCKLTLEESNIPDFPFFTGDEFFVEITEVNDSNITCVYSGNGERWENKFVRVDSRFCNKR